MLDPIPRTPVLRSCVMLRSSPSTDRPLVSAVIPTRGRPDFLACSIRSALRQTWSPLEVIVVVDGSDSATEECLALFSDPRLRVILLPESCGACAARNAGVRAAGGEWIALLDDDDEWMPDKIARQMRAVQDTTTWFPVVSCRVVAQSPTSSRILPSRVYNPSQPVADYLFCRVGLADSGGLLQTSTLLAPRDLFLAVPFREGLALHQDWDWLVQVTAHEGVAVSMVSKPLTTWRVDGARQSAGRNPAWQLSLSWIRDVRQLVSRRAFSSFVAIQCVWRAKASHAAWTDRLRLLWIFLFEGRPEWRSSLHFLAFSLVPSRLRRAVCSLLQRPQAGLSLAYTRQHSPAVARKNSR